MKCAKPELSLSIDLYLIRSRAGSTSLHDVQDISKVNDFILSNQTIQSVSSRRSRILRAGITPKAN